ASCTADKMGQTGLALVDPVSIDAITIADQDALPIFDGPTGGNVRPAAISPNTMLDNMLVAQRAVDDPSTEFPKITSTGNIPPDLCHKSASSGPLCRQSASAEM